MTSKGDVSRKTQMPRGKLARGMPTPAVPPVDPACRTATAMASLI